MSSFKLVKSIAMVFVLLLAFATFAACDEKAELRDSDVEMDYPTEKTVRERAFSDAKNALQIYLAERTIGENGGSVISDGTVFEVVKAGKMWYFVFKDNGLYMADDPNIGMSSVHNMPSCGAKIDVTDINNFLTNVTMYYPAP